ncbi:MAG: glycosyltransferase family 39 protein [Flavobacteriales bacterium]|nr:glycosyltransferase family 39 protein [Flavobacteriales bacterium]
MAQSTRAFNWLVIGICAALLLPGLVREGMFMDGMLYTVVAHNQANGFGTFWAPRFSQVGVAGMAIFHEHPPLAFGLQAWWFRVLGDGFWVERLYCLATALITMFVMVRLWRECLHEHLSLRPLGGWPLLLWIIVPQVFWCFHNNMLENTMAVFVTAAVLQVVLGMSAAWAKRAIIAGVFVFLASFTKGVPGLFPLAAPVLLWSASRNVHSFRRALLISLVMGTVVAASYLLLWQWPDARGNLEPYVNGRLLHRIDAQHTVEHRWRILADLLASQVGPLVLAAVVFLLGRRARTERPPDTLKATAIGMFLIGLSGVAPMMLTLVQKSFYSVPAFPMIATGLGLLSAQGLCHLLDRLGERQVLTQLVRYTGITAFGVALVLSVLLFAKPARDADLLADVATIGASVPAGSLVDLHPDLWNEWNLQGYLMRYHAISVDDRGNSHAWSIGRKKALPPPGYVDSGVLLRELALYRADAASRGMK